MLYHYLNYETYTMNTPITCTNELTGKQQLVGITPITEATAMNTTKQEALSLDGINKSSLVSTMTSDLFMTGTYCPRDCVHIATAFIGAIDYLDDMDMFMGAFNNGLAITEVVVVDGPEMEPVQVDYREVRESLVEIGYLCIENGLDVGERFVEVVGLRKEAYKPALASEGITRRFGYAPTQYSNLYKEAIHALEATEFTVDPYMLEIAKQVQAKLGDDDKDGYVLMGCSNMDAELAYISEFKGDRRLRMYQAACHGPNGQSSDRSRALMDLFGVPQDYCTETVIKHIRAEMADMVTTDDKAERIQLVRDARKDPVAFIIKHVALKEDESMVTIVAKPWSFVKAARLLAELLQGNMPYVGMAVGLDAKCSGPQLGALMVGDSILMQACGFSMTKVDDAYMRGVQACEKAGFMGLDRSLIKKPFMGIFYGQGVGAFMDAEEMDADLWTILYGKNGAPCEDIAKRFHKAVTSSFGAKMLQVRNAIRAYAKKIDTKIAHFMPDGSKVAMNYKVKVNAVGEAMDFDTPKYTVTSKNNMESYKFKNMLLKTKHTHCGDFARNGFVNMIQAIDALIARMIVVNLKRAGAKHIICVHDCFRVNVTEMHLLEDAIKLAYTDLFGGKANKRTADLPMGTDILGMYFEGANAALKEGEEGTMMNQFFTTGGCNRAMPKIGGHSLQELIDALGTTYYFAK